jgi:MoxR-like ATPase
MVRQMPIAEEVAGYAVRLVAATRPGRPEAPAFVNQWVNWGAGLRAAQMLVLGAKARALINGQSHVSTDDIRALVHPVLRHRLLLGYKAEAEGISIESCIDRLLSEVK